MFEKLKRAKSFVVRTKTREELDLSESSHLRRNVAINSSVIDRQKKLTIQRTGQNQGKTKLNRQTSASHEKIYDDRVILEQIRRINFGDSRNSARNEVVNYSYAKNNGKDETKKSSKDHRQGLSLKTNEQNPRQERIVKK